MGAVVSLLRQGLSKKALRPSQTCTRLRGSAFPHQYHICAWRTALRVTSAGEPRRALLSPLRSGAPQHSTQQAARSPLRPEAREFVHSDVASSEEGSEGEDSYFVTSDSDAGGGGDNSNSSFESSYDSGAEAADSGCRSTNARTTRPAPERVEKQQTGEGGATTNRQQHARPSDSGFGRSRTKPHTQQDKTKRHSDARATRGVDLWSGHASQRHFSHLITCSERVVLYRN